MKFDMKIGLAEMRAQHSLSVVSSKVLYSIIKEWLPVAYCLFNIFWKVVFCLALYTEEENLQNFVVI